jgi:ribosomal protein L16/L10AE
MLGAAQPAAAHTITKAQIRSAARDAARSIRSQTGASSAEVLRCRRQSDHRARCRIETRYSSGAGRCITVVGIRLVATKTTWRSGESTCY